MKVTKRCFALFLILVMMLTNVGELVGVTTVAHAEEAVTSLGTKEVSQTPEALLNFGEWSYWVESDGAATVAGYMNTDETSISIPARLNGHPVTGIGHRAFSANSALKEIYIPTNVTRIAGDAFQGVAGLTLSAYHGAFALDYAKENGFEASCIDSMPGVVFADGVIDLAGLPKNSYKNLTQESAVFNAGEASFLAAGQIMMFPISADFPGGLVRRVTEIVRDEDSLIVSFSEPQWEEAFDSVEGDEEIFLDWDHAVVYESEVSDYLEDYLSLHSVEDWGTTEYFEVESVQSIPEAEGHAETGEPESAGTEEEPTAEETESLPEAGEHSEAGESESAYLREDFTGEQQENVPVTEMAANKGGSSTEEADKEAQGAPNAGGEVPADYAVPEAALVENDEISAGNTDEEGSDYEDFSEFSENPDHETVEASALFDNEGNIEGENPEDSQEPVNNEENIGNEYEEPRINDAVYDETADENQLPEQETEEESVIEWNDGWEIVSDDEVEAAGLYDFSDSKNFDYNKNGQNSKSIEYGNLKGKFKLALKDGRVSYKVVTKKKLLGLAKYPWVENLQLYMPLYPSYEIEYEAKLAEKKGKILDVPYFTVGFASGNITITWDSSISGSFKLTCEFNFTIDVTLKDGDLKNNSKATNPIIIPEIEAKVETGPKFSIDLRIGTGGISISIIDLSISAKLTLKGTGQYVPIRAGTQNSVFCSELSFEFKIKGSISAGICKISGKDVEDLPGILKKLKKLKWSKEVTIYSKNFGKKHWDDLRETSSCVLKDRIVIAKSDSNERQYQCDINDLFPNPGNVSKTGYKFLGWYVNTSASGLPGSDYKINFGSTYVPYRGRTGTVYIYAKFEKNPEPVKVTSVSLNKHSATLLTTDKNGLQLNATVKPDNAADKSVSWKSSNTNVATVSANGLVKPVGVGTATITCTSKMVSSKKDTCTVTVKKPPVSSLTLDKHSVSLTTRDQNGVQLKATLSPKNVDNSAVTWKSSNTNVVTVNNGLVKVVGAGTATVTCTSVSNSSAKDTCSFTVTKPPVTGVALNRSEVLLYTNNTNGLQLNATAVPSDAEQSMTWASSNPSVVTVSSGGLVRVVGLGTATVTATSTTNSNMKATCTVSVKQPPVTGITLNHTELVLNLNDTEGVQLNAAVTATSGDTSVIWSSSNPSVATVSANGHVSMVGLGMAVITCTSVQVPDVFATCNVTVIRPPVTSVTMNQNALTLYTNDNVGQRITTTVAPSNADPSMTWTTSDASVARVYSDGLVKAVGMGTATITATSVSTPSKSVSCTVTVVKPPVSSVTLDQAAMTIFTDNTNGVQLSAVLSPEDPDNTALTWSSSNASAANVSAGGVVSPVGVGTAIITATSASNPNASASCTVTVRRPPVTSVSLDGSSASVYIDNAAGLQLHPTVLPADAEDPSLVWTSSNEVIATVDGNGLVIPANIGTTTVTARSVSNPNVSASCEITVTYPPVNSVSLDRSAAMMRTDDTEGLLLKATVLPAAAENTSVTWQSSNTAAATVDSYGMVNAIGPGSTIITATSVSSPSISASCLVTVKQFVESVHIQGEAASLLANETAQLTVEVYPLNATDSSVSWSSSNPGAATVDATGNVTAVGTGETVITALANDGSGVYDSYQVKVEKMLQLDVSQLEDTVFTQGDQSVVLAYVGLTGASSLRMAKLGETLNWTATKKSGSGDTVMAVLRSSVSENGTSYPTSLISLIGSSFPVAGNEVYTVTCTAGAYSDSVDVTVAVDGTAYAETLKLQDAEFDANTLTFPQDTEQIISSTPLSADGKTVPQGMTVSIDGDYKYYTHAMETVRNGILAVSFDMSDVYNSTLIYKRGNLKYTLEASFRVTDENGVVRVRTESLSLNNSYLKLVQGETAALSVQHEPEEVYDPSVVWESSDSMIASVSDTGVVRAISPGIAYITCTTADGSNIYAMAAVKVEAYLQLSDKNLSYTVYSGGQDHADLDIVNLTADSEARLISEELSTVWTIERISGDSTELGLEEFADEAEEGVSVSGNTIKLLRINGVGTDKYRLTCAAGSYSDSCEVTVTVAAASLPETITLNRNNYSGVVFETIEVDDSYTVSPAGSALPEDVKIRIDGKNAYRQALSGLYDFDIPTEQIFSTPGTYTAEMVFEGTNYSYRCPLSFSVADENGTVPVNITKVNTSETELNLTTGDTRTISIVTEPAGATYSTVIWSSTDTSVVSVSQSGKITAIGSGSAAIIAMIPEADDQGVCMVTVEEGLNFVSDELERTVFVDGETRMTIDTLLLTPNTSSRLAEEPKWTLRRKSGTSLTLRSAPVEMLTEDNETIFGCDLILYSVSKEGDTVYELVCSDGIEETTATIKIHAVNRDRILPASISLAQTVYTADIGELITVRPVVTTYPAGTTLPGGIRLSCEGDLQYQQAINAEDTFTSPSLSTFSFGKAGTYETRFVYAYSNMKYIVPVTFRIRNANGEVPVQTKKLTLNHPSLYLTAGETENLEAVFTPADATNQAVSWTSSDQTVATVDAQGTVRAVRNGTATIYCTPADPDLEPLTCSVTVENYLTVEAGTTSRTVYLQGEQKNTVGIATLSVGTLTRLNRDGITPVWSIETDTVTHAKLRGETTEDASGITANTEKLLSGGSDTYTLRCIAGEHVWSQNYTLQVTDLGSSAPQSVSIARTEANAAVGEAITLDFTPVITPSSASMPTNMQSLGYIGLGDFYDALDYNVYEENGDQVTVGFTKPGQYVLAKKYVLSNLEYVTACTVTVGETQGRALLTATETEFTVYSGGRSGSVSKVSLSDAMVYELWKNDLQWTAERISGNSMTVALKENGDNVDVFVANTQRNGTDVWRISCSFGGMTEWVDLTLTTADPRGTLPERIELGQDRFTGMIGNWISVPLGAVCYPTGSMLPDQGDAFWSFSFDQAGEERSDHTIEKGMLRVNFVSSGYYTGTLTYRSGNVSYQIPVYFVIQDEEEEVRKPNLRLFLVNDFDTVYPEGETGCAIAQVVLAETLSTYNTGASVAYMNETDANWTITKTGSSAKVSLQKVSNNIYNVILDQMNGSGDVNYNVQCVVNGVTYTASKSIHVAAADEVRPDATPRQTLYQAHVGETVSIDRLLYSREDASVLQASTEFDAADLLAAVGYEINENKDSWVMTFYETGNYTPYISAQVSNLVVDVPLTIMVTDRGTEIQQTVLKLPAALTSIEEEAFEGVIANVIDLRESAVQSIGANAFRNCVNVTAVYLPDGNITIDDTAFFGCINAVFYCSPGSTGAVWAGNHGFAVADPSPTN